MHELLPPVFGAVFAAVAMSLPSRGPRALWFVIGSLMAGVLASAVNGELTLALAPLFLSVDALLAWCGAFAMLILVRARSRALSR